MVEMMPIDGKESVVIVGIIAYDKGKRDLIVCKIAGPSIVDDIAIKCNLKQTFYN